MIVFALLKIFSKNGYVKLTSDLEQLQSTIETLKSAKEERARRPPRRTLWRRKMKAQEQPAHHDLNGMEAEGPAGFDH